MPTYEYECRECGLIEIFHPMSQIIKQCPTCGQSIQKLISGGAAILIKGRQANQYSDIRGAKWWRDEYGNRHRVTPSDGSYKSPSTKQRDKLTDAQEKAVKRKIDADRAKIKKTRCWPAK